jgi:MarR family transcriptional regulator, temperature-dependent positive regulator of motility
MIERSESSMSSTPPSDSAAHFELMRVLEQHPEYSQRELSRALGVSLGKTHYLLKALLGKGWVIAQNFQRSETKLGYLYVLTPSGVSQRLRLTQAFLARKEAEYKMLQGEIAALRSELASRSASPLSRPPAAETRSGSL